MSTVLSGEARQSQDNAAAELERLSTVVHKLLVEWDQLKLRTVAAEGRSRDLEAALRDVMSGNVDPITLANRVQALEQENRFLARRLDRARESVKRISARLQFLDEDR